MASRKNDRARAIRLGTADVIVVGSGIAGLVAALKLAPQRVVLLTKTADLPGGSSQWAQGGIAVALDSNDSAAAHAADTIAAGAGLTDPERALLLAEAGAEAMRRWIDAGLPVDRDASGKVALGREAAHGAARILHAGGDATGRTLIADLAQRVRDADHITVIPDSFVWDLMVVRGRTVGVLAHDRQGWVFHRAAATILATGGSGQLYQHTTNPIEGTGDGLALAARAGLALTDLEFVQFHPTALATNRPGRTPLLTEALRGAGAHLLDAAGQRFMLAEHPLAELAPRDIVARAIGSRIREGGSVFLDLRALWATGGNTAFPTVASICAAAGIDPAITPVPVAPAAHYHMGGIPTDADGRTDLSGLWAVGEVACTGVHGANRLASNSLLESLVFAERAAASILSGSPVHPIAVPVPRPPMIAADLDEVAALVEIARSTLSRRVGLVRDGAGLEGALYDLIALRRRSERLTPASTTLASTAAADAVRSVGEMRNILLVATMVALAAGQRCESRGAHFRSDYPDAVPAWRQSRSLTVADLPSFPEPTLALG